MSVNYHFALHIPDLISNYGPPQLYWCFAYERMNGILSEVPNNVELQIIYRIIQQFSIDTMAVSQDPSFDEKSFPRALKQLVSPTVMCHSHYTILMLIMHLLNQLKQCLNTSTIEELTLEKASMMTGQFN